MQKDDPFSVKNVLKLLKFSTYSTTCIVHKINNYAATTYIKDFETVNVEDAHDPASFVLLFAGLDAAVDSCNKPGKQSIIHFLAEGISAVRSLRVKDASESLGLIQFKKRGNRDQV